VAGEELQRAAQKADRGRALLVGEDLGVGQPAVVIDADVDALPAGVADAAAVWGVGLRGLAAPVAGDAVAGAQDPPELFMSTWTSSPGQRRS
jgi:hypothetical protein